ERQEHHHPVELAGQGRVDVVQAGGVTGREEAYGKGTPEPRDSVHRHRSNSIVDAEPLLDEVTRIDNQRASKHRNEVIEAWRIDISSGRDRDHSGEAP